LAPTINLKEKLPLSAVFGPFANRVLKEKSFFQSALSSKFMEEMRQTKPTAGFLTRNA